MKKRLLLFIAPFVFDTATLMTMDSQGQGKLPRLSEQERQKRIVDQQVDLSSGLSSSRGGLAGSGFMSRKKPIEQEPSVSAKKPSVAEKK